jgi:N-acetylglucosaminyldiphosphoundecaprenol N-acetyl-beta-D-mannosaminyltransferase
MKKVRILGVNIDSISKNNANKVIKGFLDSDKQHYIATVNPEFLIAAKKDEEFWEILNKADLSLADGFGIVLMSYLIPPRIKSHIRGSDITFKLLQDAEDEGFKVCILNWNTSLSKKDDIEIVLENKYPNLEFLVQDIERGGRDVNLKEINDFAPKLLFVTLGARYQEKFIYTHLERIPSVRVAMGVGGTFDFLTEKIERAPIWMIKIELEWLWRLIKEPKFRIKRIFKAVIVFPVVFIRERIINPHFYRKNVACLMYKKEEGKIKIFLGERAGEKGHFQFPQGGMEGEDIEIAGASELKEEIGTSKFTFKGKFENVYKYKFSKISAGYKHSNYKGQKQSLYITEFIGSDENIKLFPYDFSSWRWVDLDNVLNEVHLVRREGVEKFLEKFKTLKNL